MDKKYSLFFLFEDVLDQMMQRHQMCQIRNNWFRKLLNCSWKKWWYTFWIKCFNIEGKSEINYKLITTWVISEVLHTVCFLFKIVFILQNTFTGLQYNLHCALSQWSNVWSSLLFLSRCLRCWCVWLLRSPH
jgi:H+/Cl- antiporter ClcA